MDINTIIAAMMISLRGKMKKNITNIFKEEPYDHVSICH